MRKHRIEQRGQIPGASGTHGFHLAPVDLLDLLGKQLADKADGVEGQGQDTCQRAKAHRSNEQDGHDDRVKAA